MIIVEDKNIQNTIYFPRNYYLSGNPDMYKLVLNDRGTNKKYEFEVSDLFEATYDFYTFNPDFSDLPNGEYEYTVGYEESIVATGLIRLNSLDINKIYNEYNEPRTYIAYDKQ